MHFKLSKNRLGFLLMFGLRSTYLEPIFSPSSSIFAFFSSGRLPFATCFLSRLFSCGSPLHTLLLHYVDYEYAPTARWMRGLILAMKLVPRLVFFLLRTTFCRPSLPLFFGFCCCPIFYTSSPHQSLSLCPLPCLCPGI